MRKINLIFLVKSLGVGGTEKHILNLISGLNKEKFKCVVCCLSDLGHFGQVIRLNNELKIYHNLLNNKFDIHGVWKLVSILRREKPDIIYTINSALTQFWGTIVSILTGSACVTRVSATNPTFHNKRRRVVNKIMLTFASRVIAQADSHKDYLINSEGMTRDKIRVIYNGVELEKSSELSDKSDIKSRLGLHEINPVIGILARLAPEKGHTIFLKAAKKVLFEFPEARFLIIGDGGERNKLEDLAREFGIESKVFFLGARKDVPEILSILDIAVLSSYPVVETFSNAILEYMAAGKPVVATDAGSTAEMVIDGETGFLIPVGDYEALADAVLILLKDKRFAEKMGKAGRKKVEEKFTIQEMIAKYESIFLDLINSN